MKIIACEDCGKRYDFDRDDFCPKCGAFNPPVKTWGTDAQGNVYIWYASRGIETRDGMTIKGTVKNHNERDGIKQTVLTRCKAA